MARRMLSAALWAAAGLAAAAERATPARAACGTSAYASAGASSIQSAVDAAPAVLKAGDHCVTVGDGTYPEQVVVRGVQTNGFRVTISAVAGSTVTVSPPAGSTAAFVLEVPGVSLSGVRIAPAQPLPYGVLAQAGGAALSRVEVADPAGYITAAGLALGAGSTLWGSRVTVQAADGIELSGSGSSLTDSVIQSSGAAQYALALAGSAHNALSNLTVTNWAGTAGKLAAWSDSNTFTLCAFKSGRNGRGLALDQSSSNVLRQGWMLGGAADDWLDGGHGLEVLGGSANVVDRSTATGGAGGWGNNAGSGAVLQSDDAVVTGSVLSGGTGGRRPPGSLSTGGHGLLVKGSRLTVDSSFLTGGLGGRCAGGGGGPGGDGLRAEGGGGHTVRLSTMTGGPGGIAGLGHTGGSGGHGVLLSTSSSSALSSDVLIGGDGGYGPHPGLGGHGLGLEAARANALDGCSLQGGAGGGSYGDTAAGRGGHGAFGLGDASNIVRNGALAGGAGGLGDGDDGGPGGDGLYLSGSRGDSVSSCRLSAGPGGPGHLTGPAGSGIRLEGAGGVALSSDQVSAALVGLELGPQAPGAGLSISDLSFSQLVSSLAAGVGFEGGQVSVELKGLTFSDAGVPTNVDASQLAAGSSVLMTGAKGPRAGPMYEKDPAGVVAWPGFPTAAPAAAPGAPTGTVLGISSIAWTWDSMSDATSYKIYSASSPTTLLRALDASPFIQTGLSSSTAYGILVAGANWLGQGPLSPPGWATTASAPLPGPPGTPAGAALGMSSITWTWSAAPGAAAYRVFLASSPDTRVAVVTDPTLTQLRLSSSTQYGIVVQGINWYGVGPLSPPGSAVTAAAPVPGQSGVPQGLALGVSSISWTWAAAPGAGAYRVYLATSPDTRVGVVTGPSLVQTRLSSGTGYGIVVAAYNDFGPGPLSDPGFAATLGGAPGSSGADIGPAGGLAVLTPPSGQILVGIPPGAFDRPVRVTLSVPSGFPAAASAALRGTGIGVEVLLDQDVQLSKDATVTVSYRDRDAAGADPGRFVLARFDPELGLWTPLPSSAGAGRVWAPTRHFSLFQLMLLSPQAAAGSVRIFPNPLRPSQGHTAMTIAGLAAGARVRMYTLAGELVKDLSADALGTASWDGTNQAGEKAASGVYFVLAEGGGTRRTYKAAIQR